MVVDVFDVHLFDLLSHMMAYLSLCLALLLYSGEGLVSLVATECSTFVQINSGTSKRSWALPDGDPRVASVLRGNCLAACSALFILFTFQHVFVGAAGIISANGHSQDAMATSGVGGFEYKDLSAIILDGMLGTLEPKAVNHMVQ